MPAPLLCTLRAWRQWQLALPVGWAAQCVAMAAAGKAAGAAGGNQCCNSTGGGTSNP